MKKKSALDVMWNFHLLFTFDVDVIGYDGYKPCDHWGIERSHIPFTFPEQLEDMQYNIF